MLVATCLNEAREAEGLPPVEVPVMAAALSSRPTAGGESTEEEGEEYKSDSASKMGGSALASAAATPRARKAAAVAPAPPPAPRKRFTAVLFADSNTHVILTGDAGGRVDVYRVQGVAFPGEELDTTAKAEALAAAVKSLK